MRIFSVPLHSQFLHRDKLKILVWATDLKIKYENKDKDKYEDDCGVKMKNKLFDKKNDNENKSNNKN